MQGTSPARHVQSTCHDRAVVASSGTVCDVDVAESGSFASRSRAASGRAGRFPHRGVALASIWVEYPSSLGAYTPQQVPSLSRFCGVDGESGSDDQVEDLSAFTQRSDLRFVLQPGANALGVSVREKILAARVAGLGLSACRRRRGLGVLAWSRIGRSGRS